MEWISVEDRLPEIRHKVIVNVNGYWVHFDRRLQDRFGVFWNQYDGTVTHWMPLPEPPEDQS